VWRWCHGGEWGGSRKGERRVVASVIRDRVDPIMRSIFGVGRKNPPKKFSGGGGGAGGGGGSPEKIERTRVEESSQTGTSHVSSEIPSSSLGIGTRISTLDFITSSDSVSGIVIRCSSPILRELLGSSIGSSGVIALGLLHITVYLSSSSSK
ncbi:hypothetical protein Tco_1543784, partial [Tanacetum coccineum]